MLVVTTERGRTDVGRHADVGLALEPAELGGAADDDVMLTTCIRYLNIVCCRRLPGCIAGVSGRPGFSVAAVS